MRGHVIVCGLDTLGIRLAEELRRLGEAVVVVADEAPPDHLVAAERAGVPVVHGWYRDEGTLRQAGVDVARAIALVEQDDVGNLHAALTAREVNGDLRIVLRMFNDPLQRSAEALLPDCAALSASSIAAPLFVAAALDQEGQRQVEVADHRLVVAEATGTLASDSVLVPLAGPPLIGLQTLLPDAAEAGGLVLLAPADGEGPPAAPGTLGRLSAPLANLGRTAGAAITTVADRRFCWLMATILGVVAISTAIFSLFDGLTVLNAAYFTITTITTTGYGDITVLHAPLGVKVYGIALMVAGATLLALIYALLIDAFVGARLSRALGGVRRQMRDHVVVCGLGNVGVKVVLDLARRGVPLVVVEREESSPNLSTARRLGVPVVIADASREESLHSAHAERAACLIAVTDDDVTNLTAALAARDLQPALRVVLRLFDHDLAARVERTFSLSISRSVSALAAPAFAAAVLDRRVLSVIPVGRHVLLVAEAAIEPGSRLDGAATDAVDEPGAVRLICVRSSDGTTAWRFSMASALRAGDTLTVVATRAGLARLLAAARGEA